MGPPRHKMQERIAAALTPPRELSQSHMIARVEKTVGSSLYAVTLPSGKSLLVKLPAKFRTTIWLKRGGFVVVATMALADKVNKLDGEIVNVVTDEKTWRKESYWPQEFVKKSVEVENEEDEESNVGKMPPSDAED